MKPLRNGKRRAEHSKGKSPVISRKVLKLDSWKEELRKQGITVDPLKPLPKDKITAQLKDLEVSVILRVISKAVDVNLMINDEIKGKATIDVKKSALGPGVFRSSQDAGAYLCLGRRGHSGNE